MKPRCNILILKMNMVIWSSRQYLQKTPLFHLFYVDNLFFLHAGHAAICNATAVFELFPPGEEPDTAWEYCPPTEAAWCYVLAQDFSNMAAVQQGMKSLGFKGPKPNPYMERSTANLHRNLAEYMGTGAPCPIAEHDQ